MNRTSSLAAVALVLCTFTGSTTATGSLSSRLITALGVVIASQGNSALVQIRRDFTESAVHVTKPFLPAPQEATDQPQPAERPVARQ